MLVYAIDLSDSQSDEVAWTTTTTLDDRKRPAAEVVDLTFDSSEEEEEQEDEVVERQIDLLPTAHAPEPPLSSCESAPILLLNDAVSAPSPKKFSARKAFYMFDDKTGDGNDTDEESGAATLLVRGSERSVVVMCTSDTHRHHEDGYIAVGDRRLSLKAYLEECCPPDLGVLVLAGDLGLEQNDELEEKGVRGVDMRATNKREAGFQKEMKAVEGWNALFGAVLERRPKAHIVIVGGNHDGLLCEAAACPSCLQADQKYDKEEEKVPREQRRRRPWGATPAAAVEAVERALVGSFQGRVHLLRTARPSVVIEVPLAGSGTTRLRVSGSGWTPHVAGQSGSAHNTYTADSEEAKRHWTNVLQGLPTLLVTHTPSNGCLDLVSKQFNVGCTALAETLWRLPRKNHPKAVICGHVHARQCKLDDRFAVGRRHPGCLFVNAAMEMGIPQITGFRLANKDKKELMLLPRPPITFNLALDGYTNADDSDKRKQHSYWNPR